MASKRKKKYYKQPLQGINPQTEEKVQEETEEASSSAESTISFKLSGPAFFALMVSGMLAGISVVIRGTILQLKTPDNMRGRVMSVNSMFINSSNELGQFESGVAAKMLGVVPSVVFGGCMTLLVVIITWVKAPGLRKFEY